MFFLFRLLFTSLLYVSSAMHVTFYAPATLNSLQFLQCAVISLPPAFVHTVPATQCSLLLINCFFLAYFYSIFRSSLRCPFFHVAYPNHSPRPGRASFLSSILYSLSEHLTHYIIIQVQCLVNFFRLQYQ